MTQSIEFLNEIAKEKLRFKGYLIIHISQNFRKVNKKNLYYYHGNEKYDKII